MINYFQIALGFLAENNTLTKCTIIKQVYNVAEKKLTITFKSATETFERTYNDANEVCFYYDVNQYKQKTRIQTRNIDCANVNLYYGREMFHIYYMDDVPFVGVFRIGANGITAQNINVSEFTYENGCLTATLEGETKDSHIYRSFDMCLGYERHTVRNEDGTETTEGGFLADMLLTDEQRSAINDAINAIKKAQSLGVDVHYDCDSCELEFIGCPKGKCITSTDWDVEPEDIVCNWLPDNHNNTIGMTMNAFGAAVLAKC